jgi:SAM-dependent methyltransferase
LNPLPLLYHAHHARHTEDLPLWQELARRYPGNILELGCGTGRVLLPLAQAGHPVLGLDRDAQMLAYLQSQLPAELSGQVLLIQADMAAYAFSRHFSLILLPCNTFSTLPGGTRLRVLELAHQHLIPGGCLAVSLPNPAVMRRMPADGEPEVEETFAHPLDGEPVQVSSAWRRAEGKFHLTWTYDHLRPDGQVERHTLTASHELAPFEHYQAQIEQAGLQLSAAWGDYDASPYTHQSDHLLLLAVRPDF